MKKNFCFVLAICITLLFFAAPVRAEDEKLQIVSGQVVDIDHSGGEVTINYRAGDPPSLGYMRLCVTSNTEIRGYKDDIGFEDIRIGDRLEVEFYGDPMGKPTAKRIIDLEQQNW